MGRKKIVIKQITDDRIRRVTFKKRRMGLLKKAIQLSKLTGAHVELKVYYERDKSLIEYYSNSEREFDNVHKNSPCVKEYSKFFNKHYDIVAQIDERVINYNDIPHKRNNEDDQNNDADESIEGINLRSLFSLAK